MEIRKAIAKRKEARVKRSNEKFETMMNGMMRAHPGNPIFIFGYKGRNILWELNEILHKQVDMVEAIWKNTGEESREAEERARAYSLRALHMLEGMQELLDEFNRGEQQ